MTTSSQAFALSLALACAAAVVAASPELEREDHSVPSEPGITLFVREVRPSGAPGAGPRSCSCMERGCRASPLSTSPYRADPSPPTSLERDTTCT